MTQPDGEFSQTSYVGLVMTVTDEAGLVRKMTRDVSGRVVEVKGGAWSNSWRA